MFTKMMVVRPVVLAVIVGSAALLCQEKAAAPSAAGKNEFPVIMQQKVAAGTTPVGTKIQAKLAIATLVDGAVVPKDAVFSGEVIESAAKSSTDPSRLAIRMDSVQWKEKSAPVKVYLTAWIYPVKELASQDLKYGPDLPASRTWNGAGSYPDPNSRVYRPFPGRDATSGPDLSPDAPALAISDHRALMKNVESKRNQDGSVAITCKRSNIKLDKLTTYVLAAGDLMPAN
jgi:hypothetical protein